MRKYKITFAYHQIWQRIGQHLPGIKCHELSEGCHSFSKKSTIFGKILFRLFGIEKMKKNINRLAACQSFDTAHRGSSMSKSLKRSARNGMESYCFWGERPKALAGCKRFHSLANRPNSSQMRHNSDSWSARPAPSPACQCRTSPRTSPRSDFNALHVVL